jgi:hypothetical protein
MLEKLLWYTVYLFDQLKNVLNLTFNLIILVLIKFNKVVFIKNDLPYYAHKVISKDNIFKKYVVSLMHSNIIYPQLRVYLFSLS